MLAFFTMKTLSINALFLLALVTFLLTSRAYANHGPGTSGGGVSTESGETLTKDTFTFSIREDYTNYEDLSQAEIDSRAVKAGEFDYLRDSYTTSIAVAYGVTDDFDMLASLGWYSGRGFVDAHLHEGDGEEHHEVESSYGDPEGITDLVVQGKYRVMRGRPGNLAIIGGVIFPTGNDDETLSDGDSLEPSSQPGTGRFGFQGGLAYSRYLTSHLIIDTSSVYTLRTERNDFQVGDRLNSGIALAYRVTDSIQSFPQLSVFGEVNHVYLRKDESDEGSNPNSGGNALFITPGTRLRFSDNIALTVAPSFPVFQDLNGEQVKVDYKLSALLTINL